MPANYASLVFTEMLKNAGKIDLDVHFADTISIPWKALPTASRSKSILAAALAVAGLQQSL